MKRIPLASNAGMPFVCAAPVDGCHVASNSYTFNQA